jgi:FG-GAP-like repeat
MKKLCTLAVSLSLLIAGCGGGGNPISAPSLAAIQEALGQNNPYGMVPGLALGAIVLPACTRGDGSALDFPVAYSLTGLPAWLSFDAATRAIALADGATVPPEGNAASEVTYRCVAVVNATVSASRAFVVNDRDGGGVVDGKEYENGAVPLVDAKGTFALNPINGNRYRVGPHPLKIPTAIVRATVGMNSADPADDLADFDGDGLTNLAEIADGTNPFVAATAASFGTISTVPLTSAPFDITCADFNNDGRLDVALTKPIVNKVAVMLGDGNGSFGADADFGSGDSPWGVVAADVNGDGNMDLAEVNFWGATVSVLLGDGGGGFAAKADYAVGTAPQYVAAADFNDDGNVDLVVTNSAGNTLSVLLGQGDGIFGATANIAMGTAPGGVTCADFNGDGNIDIATANQEPGRNTFSVLLGRGDGTFDAKTEYPTGIQPTSIVAADLNGDSRLDIAVNTSADTVAVSLDAGDGGFGVPAEFATGNGPQSVIAADLNGDGKVDLATRNTGLGSFSVSVLLGVGDGTFAANTDYPTVNLPVALAAADLNADGALDLVVPLANIAKDLGIFLNQ